MPRRFPSRSLHGFTTIESMIAAVVFLVGLAGLLGALVQARNATGQARRLMQATDVANDLAEQIQLWDVNDPRLAETVGPCATDPLDDGHALSSTGSTFDNYVACMHNETTLKQPNTTFGGLQEPVFVDEIGNPTRYERYYIVKSQSPRDGVRRNVTAHTMRLQMGGV